MSKTLPTPWTRSTSRNRCPKCGRAGCLLSSPTDPSAVICTRTPSNQAIGNIGHLHILRDGPPWAPWTRSLARLKKTH